MREEKQMDGGRISLYFYTIILPLFWLYSMAYWNTSGVKIVGILKLLAYKVLSIAQLKNYSKYSECLEVISGDFNSVKTF